MRKIDYSQIQTNHAMPYKGGTFEHLMQSQQEMDFWTTFASMYPVGNSYFGSGNNYLNVIGGGLVLFGTMLPAAVSYDGLGAGPFRTYNGSYSTAANIQWADGTDMFQLQDGSSTGPEIFIIQATSGVTANANSCAIGSTPIWLVTGTFSGNGTNADPVTFSDTTQHYVHQTRFLQVGTTPSLVTGDYIAYQIGTLDSLTANYSINQTGATLPCYAWQSVGTMYWANNEKGNYPYSFQSIATQVAANQTTIISGVPSAGVDNLTTLTADFTALDAPWTSSFSPVLTVPSPFVLGSPQLCHYKYVGTGTTSKTLVLNYSLIVDQSGGTATGDASVTIPPGVSAAFPATGSLILVDSLASPGSQRITGCVYIEPSGTSIIIPRETLQTASTGSGVQWIISITLETT